MWKPENAIRHPVPPARWPSAEEARASRLYSPIRVGVFEARERTWVPAMVPWRATEDGEVTDDVFAWYERFGRGEPGALVVEATGIRDIPSGPLLRIGHDRYIPGLARLVEGVRRASSGRTRLLIQLIDFLAVKRRPEPAKFFGRHLEVTPAHRRGLAALDGDERWIAAPEAEVRAALLALDDAAHERLLAPRELEALRMGYRERVTDVHLPHIRDLPRRLPGLFADAARRAREAGFDGVELHFAHAYTMASFLSRTNTREDGYGGSLEGRVRLPLEVLEEVRARAGRDFTVGCRFLGDEVIEDGNRVEDACFFGKELARAGIDFLSVSKGGKFDDAKQPDVGWAVYPYTGRSGYECMPTVISDERGPFGRNVPLAAAIKRAVTTAGVPVPVVTAGGINDFERAEGILARGEADIIGSARQSLADPDWWKKMRLGRGEEIRRCVFTNYCEGLDQKHRQVTCQLWDRAGLDDPLVKIAKDGGRRRLTPPAWEP